MTKKPAKAKRKRSHKHELLHKLTVRERADVLEQKP